MKKKITKQQKNKEGAGGKPPARRMTAKIYKGKRGRAYGIIARRKAREAKSS